MGNKKNLTLIAIFVLLILAAFLVYRPGSAQKSDKPQPLDAALASLDGVDGYHLARTLPLDEPTIAFLDLDDYTQMVFNKNGTPVNLYIGYYYSLNKISAAHSPLVCFPGQGWQVSLPSEHRIQLGGGEIHYEELVATLDDHQELVIYWYQAHEQTIPYAYRNKLAAVYNKLTKGKEEHAFVRVTVPIENSAIEPARTAAREFITLFYPAFLDYVNSAPQPMLSVAQPARGQ